MAFSNQLFALPIIAWGCAISVNAPTRTTDVCACSNAETPMTRHTVNLQIAPATGMRVRRFISFLADSVRSHDHGQNTGISLLPAFSRRGLRIGYVFKRGAFENLCGSITHI